MRELMTAEAIARKAHPGQVERAAATICIRHVENRIRAAPRAGASINPQPQRSVDRSRPSAATR